MLKCCIVLGKTQFEIENGYAFIDLPELLVIQNEQKAMALLDQLDVVAFPHITDKAAREAIIKRIKDRLPQAPPVPPKSAEDQYQAQLARMKGG